MVISIILMVYTVYLTVGVVALLSHGTPKYTVLKSENVVISYIRHTVYMSLWPITIAKHLASSRKNQQ